MGKNKRRKKEQKENFKTKIQYFIGEIEILIPWVQIEIGFSYSYVRDLNVFENLILDCLSHNFNGSNPDLSLRNIALIAGLDERGINFLKPFVTNFNLNNTITLNDIQNPDDLKSYSISDNGYKLFLKGKTSIKEKGSSINLYYSPLIHDFLKEQNLNFQKPKNEKKIYQQNDASVFENDSDIDISYFDYQNKMDQEKLTQYLMYFKVFSQDDIVSINPNITFNNEEFKWEKRTIQLGLDKNGLIRAEIKYNDSDFNDKLSSLFQQGEICNEFLEIEQNNSNLITNQITMKNFESWFQNTTHCFIRKEFNERIQKICEASNPNHILICNLNPENSSFQFKAKLTTIITFGDDNSFDFEVNEADNIVKSKISFSINSNMLPSQLILDNVCYEEGNLLLSNEKSSEIERFIKIVKEYRFTVNEFFRKYNLGFKISEIGKKIPKALKKLEIDKKIPILKIWNQEYGIYFNTSQYITQEIEVFIETKANLNETEMNLLLDWIQDLPSTEIIRLFEAILTIKLNNFNSSNYENDLLWKKKIDTKFKLEIKSLDQLWANYFIEYYPFLKEKSKQTLDFKQIKEEIIKLNRIDVNDLTIRLQSFLITIPNENLNLDSFLEYLGLFEAIKGKISEETKGFIEKFILKQLNILIDLKLSTFDTKEKKEIKEKRKMQFIQVLRVIQSLHLNLPNYSVFQRMPIKDEINILNKLKEEIKNPKSPKNENVKNEDKKASNPWRIVILDGSNIARNKQNSKTGDLNDVLLCKSSLISKGLPSQNLFIIFGAGLRHYLISEDQKKLFEKLIQEKNINQAPKGTNDDWFIIDFAMKLSGTIISNDNYQDFRDKDPKIKEYLEKNIIKYTILGDNISFEADFLSKLKNRDD